MKLNRFYTYCLLLCLIIINGCSCNRQQNGNTTSGQQSEYANEILLREDFENATKKTYATGKVNFSSGTWSLTDALTGTSAADAKEGSQSVRLREKGQLKMSFDVDGASSVSIKHAAYGKGSSNWELRMSVDGGRTFKQVGDAVQTSGRELQTATFTVNQQGPVRFQIRKTASNKSRINIDDFIIYRYNAQHTPAATPIAPSNTASTDTTYDNLLLGNPSNAATNSTDNYLMATPYYTLSYNCSKGGPNWVSWYVGKVTLGDAERENDFRPNAKLPKSCYLVLNTSYQGSGFERGHNCPSADRTSSTAANSATFLMTNMIPQAPANNQHTWGNLENYERLLVKQGNEVYVIMGSYGTGGYGTRGYRTTIDNGHIQVPSQIWKVIVVIPDGSDDLHRINQNTRVIAVNTPNNNGVDANWTKYICTVRDIEKATGYNLLSKLPKSVQDAIETKKDAGIDADDAYIMRF
ncbi:DNA/RNA non-specific endonuclease [Mucilaginibacter sp. Bleaf8]|uniref:DNA/RNA non-specific endonuclease n=1 Tax=Mucilaginibacter sp. Bleaf8 TaxID=2834430 RepID=UPI001BCC49AE|nr:DNA/RNA non-specific endonuclease [Mucilaginibacter sp. Bleaf8]MBS7563668.1 DNA/RNA non-specific endonuclease [Mucilaginibacter sp. Bleaf8]